MNIINWEECPNCGNENSFAEFDDGTKHCIICDWKRVEYDMSHLDPAEVIRRMDALVVELRAQGSDVAMTISVQDPETADADALAAATAWIEKVKSGEIQLSEGVHVDFFKDE